MLNPFQESFSENNSMDQTSLPICFAASQEGHQFHSESPISILQFDRVSQQLTNEESNGDLVQKNYAKEIHQMLRQLKLYSESLQRRNLEIICELQKQRSRYKQLVAMFTFLKTSDQQRDSTLEQKSAQLSEVSANHEIEKNKRQLLQSEIKTLRLQNTYLKDLILIANNNYQKLQEKNKGILDKFASLEQENSKREIEMLKKTEEIKNMFAAIVIEKNNVELKEQKGKIQNMSIGNNTININNLKTAKKEHTDEAYRSLFLKTLKGKKENVFKQA